jgi:hypothetical protein
MGNADGPEHEHQLATGMHGGGPVVPTSSTLDVCEVKLASPRDRPRRAPAEDRSETNRNPRGVRRPKGKLPEANRSHLLKRPEDSCFVFGPDGHELSIYREDTGFSVTEIVRRSPLELALLSAPPLLVLAYRFFPKGVGGSAPIAWHLLPPTDRVRPDGDGQDAPSHLTVALISSDDFGVRATRSVELTPDFARLLRDAIRAQTASPFDSIAYTRAIAAVHLDRRGLWAQQERIVVSMATWE